MAVTQYIGSRYVPLFADPIEWSASNTYEPLTIVLHEGNSYTSKQAVPKGVDIDNEAFWALTGNYNAQVELYRRETAAAKATADNAQSAADNAQSAADNAQSAADNAQSAADDAQADATAAQTDIDTLLPKAAFSAANTVKKYVDDSIDTLSNNVVHSDSGCALEFISGDTYKGYCITIPKEKYRATLALTPETLERDPNNDNRCSNPALLMDYARREHPYLCSNITNTDAFIYHSTVCGPTYTPPHATSGYVGQKTADSEIELFSRVSDASLQELSRDYANLVTVWYPVIENSVPYYNPPYQQTNHRTNPMMLFGWNETSYFLIHIVGRLKDSKGAMQTDLIPFGMAKQMTNLMNMDGGGSANVIFGETLSHLTPMINGEQKYRTNCINLSFVER